MNASVTAGNYDEQRGELGLSGPIVAGRVSGRASFVYDDRGGYRKNVTLGKREDGVNLKGTRESLYFTLADGLDLVLRGDYAKQRSNGALFINLQEDPTALGISPSNVGGFLTFPDPSLGGASLADVFGLSIPQASPPIVVNPNDLKVYTEQPSHREVRQKGLSGTLTWDTSMFTAKLISAYRDSRMKFINDSDGTNILLLTNDALQTDTQTTHELNISGTAWNSRLEWLLGGYYFEENGFARFYYDLDALQTTYEAIFGIFGPGGSPLPPGSLAAFGTRLKTGQPSAAPFLDFRMHQDSESKAVFGQSTLSLTDSLRLTLGARYTKDDKKVHRELTNNLGGAPCDRFDDKSWNETTGTAIVDYDLGAETMVYGSLSTGYKAGGYNPGECADAFDPEKITAYEGGIKTRVLDGRLQLNGALFKYKYDDIQVNRFVNNASSITNAAQADILGAELEFVAVPWGGLSLDGGVTWLDTEYGGGATFSDPIAGGALINVDGNDLLRSPEWKLYLGAQYEWDTPVGQFMLRADTAYSSHYYFDVFQASLPNQSKMKQSAYDISNVRASWQSVDGRYQVQAYVENVGDELYAETRQAIGTTGAVIGEFSAPRRYGLRVSMKLGGDR